MLSCQSGPTKYVDGYRLWLRASGMTLIYISGSITETSEKEIGKIKKLKIHFSFFKILYSETFFELLCLDSICARDFCCFFFFDIYIFQLFPFILSLYDESFYNLSLCRHELTELDTFIFEDLYELIDLKLGKCRDRVDDALFLERRKGK